MLEGGSLFSNAGLTSGQLHRLILTVITDLETQLHLDRVCVCLSRLLQVCAAFGFLRDFDFNNPDLLCG